MSPEALSVVAATLLGPVFAVQAQQWLERWRAARERRLDVFKTLMATRGGITSARHVEALNRIDLEFQHEKFREVREAWHVYHDHLSINTQGDPGATTVWLSKTPDLLAKMLGAMARVLGYRFDEVAIKRGGYTPSAHVNDEEETRQVRGRLLQVLSGASELRVKLVSTAPEGELAKQLERYKKTAEEYERAKAHPSERGR